MWLIYFSAILQLPITSNAFSIIQEIPRATKLQTHARSSKNTFRITSPSSLPSTSAPEEEPLSGTIQERHNLKRSLLSLSASYDRGFGATPSSRSRVEDTISQLERLNPTPDAARGVDGDGDAPLRGIWRMVWTTAQDVLLLAASPVTTVGAIYQVIEPPVATNIIDLIPRAQALLPPGIAPSLLRLEVLTRTKSRGNFPLRVGLTFEEVKAQPVDVLGISVKDVLPPIGMSLPRLNFLGMNEQDSPGYFDVAYLDEELLIIKQNAPGGLFALVRAESDDP